MLVPLDGPQDRRPALALVVSGAVALIAALLWPWFRWVLGAVLLVAVLRAIALVLAARAAGQPPDEEPAEPPPSGPRALRPPEKS